MLLAQGMPMAQCGTFVGKLAKAHGDEVVVEAVREAVVLRPADVASWLVKACQQRAGPRRPPAAKRHAGFETMDYRQGIAADGSLT